MGGGCNSLMESLLGGRGGGAGAVRDSSVDELPLSLSVRPRIFKLSADLRKELSWSWATLTSPLYMNWSKEKRSSYLMSLSTMIGCWQGLP